MLRKFGVGVCLCVHLFLLSPNPAPSPTLALLLPWKEWQKLSLQVNFDLSWGKAGKSRRFLLSLAVQVWLVTALEQVLCSKAELKLSVARGLRREHLPWSSPLQLPALLETLPREQVWSWFPAGALGPPSTSGILGQRRFDLPRMVKSCLFLLFSFFTSNCLHKAIKTANPSQSDSLLCLPGGNWLKLRVSGIGGSPEHVPHLWQE